MCVWPAGTIIMMFDITLDGFLSFPLIHPSIRHSCFSSTGRVEGLEPIPAVGEGGAKPWTNRPYCKATQKTGRSCKLHTERRQGRESNPQPSCSYHAGIFFPMLHNNNTSPICKVHALFIWLDPRGPRGTAQLFVMSQRALYLIDTYAADLVPPAQQTCFCARSTTKSFGVDETLRSAVLLVHHHPDRLAYK